MTCPGYWGTIWYATSNDDGYHWRKQGKILGLGKKDMKIYFYKVFQHKIVTNMKPATFLLLLILINTSAYCQNSSEVCYNPNLVKDTTKKVSIHWLFK